MVEKTLIPEAQHEPRDVSGRFILSAFLLLVTSVAAVGLVVWGIFPHSVADKQIASSVSAFPAPQLQPDATADWKRFYAEEMQRLNSYGWVDQAHGVVHIPIDRAMQKVASQGIPGWPTSERPKE